MTTEPIKSVCPYCGVGCGILLEVADNRVVKVTGDPDHPSNYGRLCTKGNTCAQAITESGRLEYAYKRTTREAAPLPIQMNKAISETAKRLRSILDIHGPDALSFYVSGQMSLESQYLINKLAKGYIQTNNIESNSRLCMASAGTGYKLSLGSDGPPGSYQDMDQSDLFFVIGANMADCHPILFLRVMDRVKAGAKLIVVDPRRNATADKATLFMQINPGTDLALLNGLLYLLVQNQDIDEEFIHEFTLGWKDMPAFLEEYPPDKVSQITGIPEKDIRQVAQWIGASGEWMSLWTMGLNQSTHGTWHTNAICNLHLATGKICRPGSGPFSLTGQPNAMGGREMGYMGPGLPGQRSVLVEADRHFIEDMWNIPQGTLRTEVGTGTVSMFQSMQTGDIKACWIICTNPVATVPNRKNVIAGLQAAELVITQDAFLDTETNQYADILLPGALWSEAEGVMINSERNLTLMQKAVEPPGEVMPDWKIIAQVACEMGYADAFTYESSADVYREIQQAWNPKTGYDIRGASYERLRNTPIQWPCAPEIEHHRNPIRYLNTGISQTLKVNEDGHSPRIVFATESGKAVFLARPYLPPAEMPDEEFPFVLNTGRLQHQWHTLTKTGKIPKLNKLNPSPFIEIHPEDAAMMQITDQDSIEIRSRRGMAILPAVVTDRVQPGNCFAPFHWNDVFGKNLAINDVTNDAIDPISLQPEFKFCAISLVRVAEEHFDPIHSLQREAMHMGKVDALATMLGVESSTTLTLETHEKMYLAGFITSLRSDEFKTTSGVPVLPPTAPLDATKKIWLDGVLAGMFSRTFIPEASSAPLLPSSGSQAALMESEKTVPNEAISSLRVTILWASQTGNAEEAAEECSRRLQAAGYDTKLTCMDDYVIQDLSNERYVLFIASTFGAGDPPDNGTSFWQNLQADHTLRLTALSYAVLALGDSNYDLFCGFGKNLDTRLDQLGARRLMERMDCDSSYPDFIEDWVQSIKSALHPQLPDITHTTHASEATAIAMAETATLRQTYDRTNPLTTRLISSRSLSKPGSEKDTRHYVFDLKNTGLHYEAGDALGVWPTNCPELVDELLRTTNLQPSIQVKIKDQSFPIHEALLRHLEITRVTPEALRFLADRSKNAPLQQLIASENKEALQSWLYGRQLVDILQEYPVEIRADDLIGILKPMQPRLYSISSSYNANPDEVHITVSTVRYPFNQHLRKGVCSTFLAERSDFTKEIPIYIQKAAHFRPPTNPDAPMIMVGPGTGIGPFLGFLQERQAVGARGDNWLFFGEQRAEFDFYYQEELQTMQHSGILHRLDTAFSRDQNEKIYVQTRMMEHGAELWSWLQKGAHFYICGDANQMAREVDLTLKSIIQQHGGLTEDEAAVYVKAMLKSKRYAKDVY
ncbi:sulfite reductase subunit alpha [Paenibacillus sp. QZ-Y1]|uniref:sulfite reductase subunit alpha n=1 Tax=Paenibacillus sp. QZ-Y1 TaxID=3414511 RepID=UPI003F79ADD3